MQGDPTDLERFVVAQAAIHDRVREEMRDGRKLSHWMWFVFPQLHGLGGSAMSQFYGIASLGEARAYLRHPLLGPRLRELTELVLGHRETSLNAIFGSPDDMKFRSSMTLFDRAENAAGSPWRRALAQFCGGVPDPATLTRLGL